VLHHIIAGCRPNSDEGVDCPSLQPNPTVIGRFDPTVIIKSSVVNAQTRKITMEEIERERERERERESGRGSTMFI